MGRNSRQGSDAVRLPDGVLDRPRLRAILDGGSALTIVSGPAGSGKSTLLAQWARAQPDDAAEVIQVSFGSENTNTHTVWRAALEQLSTHGIVEDAAALIEDVRGFHSLRDPLGAVHRNFRGLVGPCVVVIDNFERADEASFLEELVTLLEQAPELRIVISTRRSMTTRLLQIVAGTDTAFIGPVPLLFTEEEAREVIERVSQRSAPADSLGDVSALPISARIVGLTLLSNQWPLGMPDVGTASVADALMARLISEDNPVDFREFLLQTALASAVTLEIADRLGLGENAPSHIDRAETLGLGMWEATAGGVGFVYTPLLREALVRHIERGSPVEVRALRRVIALWAFENRLQLEALSNALDAKDYALASRFVRKSWFVLSQTRAEDMAEILKKQGPAVLTRFPVLSTAMALVMIKLGHRLRAYGYFQSAILSSGRHRDGDEDLTEQLWWESVRSLTSRLGGQFDRAEAAAQRIRDIYLAMNDAKRAEVEDTLSLLLSSCGLGLFYAGRIDDAVAVLEWGMAVQVPDDDAGWYHCAATLAGIRALDGRLSDARSILDQIDEADPPVSWQTDFFGVLEQIARARIALADLDFAGAQNRLDSVAHLLTRSEHWPFYLCVQSEIHLLAGRAAEARAVIETAFDRGAYAKTSRFALEQLHLVRALTLLALGNQSATERSFAVMAKSPSSAVVAGFRALLSGQSEAAFTALGGVAAGVDQVSSRDLEVLSLLTFALASLRLGRRELGAGALARASAALAREQTMAPLLLFSSEDLAELSELADGMTTRLLTEFRERAPKSDRTFLPLAPPVALTSRELAVLGELAKTGSTAAIASALFVSPNTVKVQRGSVYRKLGVSSREEALVRAVELGLLATLPVVE